MTKGPSPLPTWVDDLSPTARDILDFFMRKLTPDDGSFHITAPAQSDTDRLLQPGELDFNSSSDQEGLTAELLDMRVDPVDNLLDKLKVRYQMRNITRTTNCGRTPTRSQAPRAQALRSRRETFGGRRFNGRGFSQTACKLNNCLFKRNGREPQVTSGHLSISCFYDLWQSLAHSLYRLGYRVRYRARLQPALSFQTLVTIHSSSSDEPSVRA
ncbi:hypothetical protein FCOIX_128 [Fusarium coicis]|nr:hypothetical protein FCOIX_128 [Fusarium coicis]